MKAAEWTAALRSGKYEQGQNALCDGSFFCCLGVLAEVAGFEKVVVDPEFQIVEYLFPWGAAVFHEEAVIPPVLQAELLEDLDLGMRVPAAVIDGHTLWAGDLHTRLINLNDNGATFETIADYIDEVANGQR